MSKKAAKPDPEANRPATRMRVGRIEARRAKAERNLRLFNLLKAGVPVAEIALQEGLSVRRARELVQEMLERREIDPPAGFVQLQIGRLGDAMMVAHTAMMEGDLKALDRVLRIVGELDRYHGFARAQASAGAAATRVAPRSHAPARPARADRGGGKSSRKGLKTLSRAPENGDAAARGAPHAMMSGVSASSSCVNLSRNSELALLQPLQLQLIGLPGVAQRFDGGVEVAVLFAQPLQLIRQNGALFLAQILLRHAPFRPNQAPGPARAPPQRICECGRKFARPPRRTPAAARAALKILSRGAMN